MIVDVIIDGLIIGTSPMLLLLLLLRATKVAPAQQLSINDVIYTRLQRLNNFASCFA